MPFFSASMKNKSKMNVDENIFFKIRRINYFLNNLVKSNIGGVLSDFYKIIKVFEH